MREAGRLGGRPVDRAAHAAGGCRGAELRPIRQHRCDGISGMVRLRAHRRMIRTARYVVGASSHGSISTAIRQSASTGCRTTASSLTSLRSASSAPAGWPHRRHRLALGQCIAAMRARGRCSLKSVAQAALRSTWRSYASAGSELPFRTRASKAASASAEATGRGSVAEMNERCGNNLKLLVRTATNTYFPQVVTVISLPQGDDALARAVDSAWENLRTVENLEALTVIFKQHSRRHRGARGPRPREVPCAYSGAAT